MSDEQPTASEKTKPRIEPRVGRGIQANLGVDGVPVEAGTLFAVRVAEKKTSRSRV
jgi:hypothetical protein